MAIDLLHDKIRKLKNPSVIDFSLKYDALPPALVDECGSVVAAYERFCCDLMEQLRDFVPAVRFGFNCFSLLGSEGLSTLGRLLGKAREMGFYVLLDSPEILSPWAADRTAQMIFEQGQYDCDGLIINAYIGSDAIKPFAVCAKDMNKDLFVLVHSANKSAVELQDLLTGTRHVYDAAAEMVNRFAEPILGKCGYSQIGAVASAGSAQQLSTIRAKHNRLFLLVDGLDYPGGNAKNCSNAFDRFGYGAVVCAGPSVTAAWQETEERDYAASARQAAERMKKNLNRYVTIL